MNTKIGMNGSMMNALNLLRKDHIYYKRAVNLMSENTVGATFT